MSEATAPTIPASEEDKAPHKRSSLLRGLTIGAVSGLVAVAASALGLVFALKPDFRPDPGIELSGTLNVLRSEDRVFFREYLRRTGYTSPRARYLKHIWGELYYVRVHAQGLKRHEGDLRWYLYNAKTKRRVGGSEQNVGIARARYGTTSDQFIVPIWYQPPADPGKYFLRFEFYARGALLALADSKPFPACRSTGCGAYVTGGVGLGGKQTATS